MNEDDEEAVEELVGGLESVLSFDMDTVEYVDEAISGNAAGLEEAFDKVAPALIHSIRVP